MNVQTLMQKVFDWCNDGEPHDYSSSCDTLKCGSPETELHRVAVAMIATPEVIRKAAAWGAELLIVHEPTFYDHFDRKMEGDPVTEAKERLLRETGIAIWRFHDHPHAKRMDMIHEGGAKCLGLPGEWVEDEQLRHAVRFRLAAPLTARELAAHVGQTFHCAHVRICGAPDVPCTRLSFCLGACGMTWPELKSPDTEIVLTGETCEWQLGEYARDAGELGFHKALLILGHMYSEQPGMRLLADMMQEHFKELEVRCFDCGETWSYAETPLKQG